MAVAYNVLGPYTHENLDVFLIHGADRQRGKPYLTLQEAMEQNKAIVHETSNVNELAVENTSTDDEIYVQSGDIVKGGKQDRVIAVDFIVPAKSGRIPISAFCVEQGRWRGRGAESTFMFSSSGTQLASRQLKLAAKQTGSQQLVWQSVAEVQRKLTSSIAMPVEAIESQTSLQLTLEHEQVQGNSDAYTKKLAGVVAGKPDVIGYAFAINGRVNSADAYVSHDLFVKLWPKLLKASAIEALAELQKDKPHQPATAEAVRAMMVESQQGKESGRQVGSRVNIITQESGKSVYFRTHDAAKDNLVVHENWIAQE